MTRQRPKPRTTPANARRSKLRPCTYQRDDTLPDPRDPDHPDHPLCRCGLHYGHPRHTPPDGVHKEQAEHRRRTGDRDDEETG